MIIKTLTIFLILNDKKKTKGNKRTTNLLKHIQLFKINMFIRR